MSGEAEEKVYEALCRLIAAWVNDVPLEIRETPDYEALFLAAERHRLTAAACSALERTGLMARCPLQTAGRFQQKKVRSIRKTMLMDAERETLLDFFEKSGIWYLPLKGVVLNGLYPQYGTRQFADNDILFDGARWREVRDFMKSLGYNAESVGKGAHDAYHKPPIYSFALHRRLFADGGSPFLTAAASYYGDVKERLVKDAENRFGRHFRDEDFYVCFLAHSYDLWNGGGAGLRTVLDVYLYRRARGDMEEGYIADELEKLGLTGFEALFRALGEKLFGSAPRPGFTREEQQALARLERSGVHGTLERGVQSGLRRLQGGKSVFRLGAEKVKGLVSRPFQKPISKWPEEKRVAKAMGLYEKKTGSTFDLAHPTLFTEKRTWYLLFYEHPDMTRLYDKYLFKSYVEEKLGSGWTAPLYGMWTRVRDLERDWDSLPDSFCLKSNCSSLGKNVVFVRDKRSVDKKALFRKAKKWLDPMNTGINSCNRAYHGVTPRIIAEKLLTGKNGQLNDYKVMCFGGKADHFLATADRFPLAADNLAYTFYDLGWNKLPVTSPGHENRDVPRPEHLEKMIQVAEKLSKGFPHIRVDFYDTTDGLYIGEMTLYSSPAYEQPEWDLRLGNLFELPREKLGRHGT